MQTRNERALPTNPDATKAQAEAEAQTDTPREREGHEDETRYCVR